jgi:hypothetical protein
VINTCFPLESFNDLLSRLTQLRYLSINYLVSTHYPEMETENKVYSVVLKHLKFVSLKLDWIRFNRLEDFIKKLFCPVEVLRFTTEFDQTYSDAKRWQQVISSSLPNVRIFDLNHDGYASQNQPTFHVIINQFNSSFWIEKQWFLIQMLEEANCFYSNIKLTSVIDNCATFFDLRIENNNDILATSVYYKEVAEPYVIPLKSDHPRHRFGNIIHIGLLRAVRYSSTLKTFDDERHHIRLMLLYNG